MAVMIHTLKIWPAFFSAVIAGNKRAELRKNDRNFKRGDVISLCEWEQGKFTGREVLVSISHVLPVAGIIGVENDWVVLSIGRLTPLEEVAYVSLGVNCDY